MCVYIRISISLSLSLYIYIYMVKWLLPRQALRHGHRPEDEHREGRGLFSFGGSIRIEWLKGTPNPPTKSLDFRGFASSRLLILRDGNSHVR